MKTIRSIALAVTILLVTGTPLMVQARQAKIAVGSYQSVVLDEKRDVYTFGPGVWGELGHGGDRRMDIARPIDDPMLNGKTVVDFSISRTHILFLTSDGNLYGSGKGTQYALGPSNTGSFYHGLVQISHAALDTATIIQVLADDDYSFFLSDKGTVFAIGTNNNGFLGTGIATSPITTPTAMNLTNLNGEKVVKIVTSNNHRLLLTDANNLYAVGENSNGQLGIGNKTSQTIPVAVPMAPFAGKTIKDILAVQGVSRVITTDGTLYSWGNHLNSLGMGTLSSNLLVPTQVTHPSLEGKAIHSVDGIVNNFDGTILTSTDGTVFAVGENNTGQLGTGNFGATDTAWTKIPATYFDNKAIVDVNIGLYMSLFRAADGTVYGAGEHAGTGYSSHTARPLPISTTFLQGKTITKMDIGVFSAVFLTSEGQVFMAMSKKRPEALGNIESINPILNRNSIKSVPTKLTHSNLSEHTIVDVKAGSANTFLLTAEGKVFSFGRGATGSLGLGDSVDVYVPTLIDHPNIAGKRIIDIAVYGMDRESVATSTHALLLADDGTVFAMGGNKSGQLGLGDYQNRAVPTPVTTNLSGKTIVKVVAGFLYSMAIASDGSVFMWGEGTGDYMGFGNSNDVNVPTLAPHVNVEGKKVIDAAIGTSSTLQTDPKPHFLFLTEDHSVYAMGVNNDGTLGLGYKNATIVRTALAIVDTMLTGEKVVEISAGWRSSMLRTESGKLFGWGTAMFVGFNTSTFIDYTVPTLVTSSDLSGKKVVDVATNSNHGLALMEDGTVMSFWGEDIFQAYGVTGNGNLNDGTSYSDYPDQKLPTRIASFTTYASPVPTGNLALHLDAGRLGYLSTNDSVNTWSNLADANQNAFQDNLARRAMVLDSAINHLPALRFNGTNSYVTLPTAEDLGIQNSDYELFLVAQSGVSHSSFVNFLVGSESLEQYELHLNGAAGARFIPNAGKYVDVGTAGDYTDTKPHVFNVRASDTEGVMSVNRTQTTHAGSARSSLAGHLYLGVRADNSYSFYGDMAEVIIYNKVLSPSERGAVESYLFKKYAIQNYKESSGQLTGTEGWRLLASPVADSSFAPLLKPFWTQGFTGAKFEGGTPNVYVWPDTASTNAATNWKPVTNMADSLNPGQGVLAYVFSDDNGPGVDGDAGFPKTFSLEGREPDTDQILTSLLNKKPNGWALLGNPFRTDIDWDGFSKTGMSNSVYLYDHNAAGWKSWNGSVGSLSEGKVGAFNAFFVQTLSESPALSIPLSAKTDSTTRFLGKTVADQQAPMGFSVQLHSERGLENAAWFQFSEQGAEGIDANDAYQLNPLTASYTLLASKMDDNTLLDINHLPIDKTERIIPLYVESTDAGRHHLSLNRGSLPEDWEVHLLDHATGTEIELSSPYEFQEQPAKAKRAEITPASLMEPVLKAKTTNTDRFSLLIKTGTLSSEEAESELPRDVNLDQNYPNPFNPSTVISYQLPVRSRVTLQVFDVLGREVATLVSGQVEAGYHQVTFNASNLSSGMYIYRLQAGNQVFTKKLTLIK